MTAKCLMIQGTGSGVGKSLLTAAFCRKFYQDGYKVAPFKAQNMSLNSFVTIEGGEMGRAQAYQAEACGIEPHVSMNPILLKPCGDNMSQVILMGQAKENNNAKDYFAKRKIYRKEVKKALDSLRSEYDIIVIEGAGSPAEINLKKFDFVNMQTARWANAPVFLVGDIDRGGVFAWLKGTLDLLDPEDNERVKGFIINKFRGDIDLLTPGLKLFEKLSRKPNLGVVPFYQDLFVDEEDAIPSLASSKNWNKVLEVVILRLPRISNFTDFSPLAFDPNVSVRYVWKIEQLGNPDLIILPGSKNTIDDLAFLNQNDLVQATLDCWKKGTVLLGICAGFQMLGKTIRDPEGFESQRLEIVGLGVFDANTEIKPEKTTRQVEGITSSGPVFIEELRFRGYEIHMGSTSFNRFYPSLFKGKDETTSSGFSLEDGTAIGTYLHGFFDQNDLREAFLNHVRRVRMLPISRNRFDYGAFRKKQLNRLAGLINDHIDMNRIREILT